MKKRTTKSSDNVFLYIFFYTAYAAVLQMRANLMGDLRLYIEKNELTELNRLKKPCPLLILP
ncbi:MAG: hypothetical protein FD130_2289 [Halothiobacillaceae bacterium]|nr:MAG: hypothetical protein FD130_2289 [Halothiobacillaceae bacterium]